MTTTVKITTHDWPVKVDFIDKMPTGKWPNKKEHVIQILEGNSITIPPHSERECYPHDSRRITITELPLPDVDKKK